MAALTVCACTQAARAGGTERSVPNDDAAPTTLAFDGRSDTVRVGHRVGFGFHSSPAGFRGGFGSRPSTFGFRPFNHFGNGFRFRRFDRFEDRLENRFFSRRFDRFEDRFERRFFRPFVFDRFEDRFERRFFSRPFAFDRFEDRFERRFFSRPFAFDRFEDRFERRFFRPFAFDRFEDRLERRFFFRPFGFDRLEDRLERRFFFRPFGFDRMESHFRFDRLTGRTLDHSPTGGSKHAIPATTVTLPAKVPAGRLATSGESRQSRLEYLAYGEGTEHTEAAERSALPVKKPTVPRGPEVGPR
jgi:hypothetical protein